VAWVQGVCYGGGLELLLHCDYSFCCETTKLALPEVKYGMIPGAGGVTLLQHRMSKADAFYYLSTGDEIPLDKAFNCGLIQQIISIDRFEEAIERKTKFYNEANGFALKALKKITKVNNNAELEAVYRMESDYFSTLLFENGRKGIDKNFKK